MMLPPLKRLPKMRPSASLVAQKTKRTQSSNLLS
jgi:hypothetical protein